MLPHASHWEPVHARSFHSILSQPRLSCQGKVGEGNIAVHSQKERRYLCTVCGHTFAATKDTPFYRLHKAADLMTLVLTLLCPGCPVQAIVAAFGLDERTVAGWQARAGQHCRQVHEHLVQQGRVDLQHVQADEIWVKMVGRKVWMAMAIAAPSRLWLGGVISAHRDGELIANLVKMVRSCASSLAILVCVDGLSSYITVFLRVFRNPVRTGHRGRPESPPSPAPEGSSHKRLERTPAMAAGLTDHPWTMTELLSYQVPLPAWVAPKRRGRPPKRPHQPMLVGLKQPATLPQRQHQVITAVAA